MIGRDLLRKAIFARLSGVVDPETGVDVVRMRLIEELAVDQAGVVRYTFRPSSPWPCRWRFPSTRQWPR
jgi:metal-sulfur cluster biosynthetic enzyme